MMNLILIICCPSYIQGREPIYVISFFLKTNNTGLYSDIYRIITFKLVMTIKASKLYNLISVFMTELNSRSQLYWKSKTFVSILSEISQ